MSSPRPGKRPRSGGMEGSTVLVPHNHQAPPAKDSSSSSLIMMLAKSCQKHEEQHNKDGTIENDYDENHVPPLCAKALQTLTRIIPKVEKAYRAAAHPAPMDIQHLCDFYLSVVQRKFCPSALHLFEYGKNPRQSTSTPNLSIAVFRTPDFVGVSPPNSLSLSVLSQPFRVSLTFWNTWYQKPTVAYSSRSGARPVIPTVKNAFLCWTEFATRWPVSSVFCTDTKHRSTFSGTWSTLSLI